MAAGAKDGRFLLLVHFEITIQIKIKNRAKMMRRLHRSEEETGSKKSASGADTLAALHVSYSATAL